MRKIFVCLMMLLLLLSHMFVVATAEDASFELLENGDFENSDSWLWTKYVSASVTYVDEGVEGLCISITGRTHHTDVVKQEVTPLMEACGPGIYTMEADVRLANAQDAPVDIMAVVGVYTVDGKQWYTSDYVSATADGWTHISATVQITYSAELSMVEFYFITREGQEQGDFRDLLIDNCSLRTDSYPGTEPVDPDETVESAETEPSVEDSSTTVPEKETPPASTGSVVTDVRETEQVGAEEPEASSVKGVGAFLLMAGILACICGVVGLGLYVSKRMGRPWLYVSLICIVSALALIVSGILCMTRKETPENPPKEESAGIESSAPSINKGEQNEMLIDKKSFKNPDNKYRGLRIAHEYISLPGRDLSDKIKKLSDYGFGGVVTNDVWDNDYLLGDMTHLNQFVQSAHDAGLRVWIYDEKGYPSGSAGDLTCQGHPEYEAVRLTQLKVKGNGTQTKKVALPDAFVQLEYACLQTSAGYMPARVTVQEDQLVVEGTEGSWVAYIYCVTKYNFHFEWNSSYPNILNREAIARFIEVTLDTYAGRIENFSETVEAIFDDEAQLLAGHHILPGDLSNPVIPYDYDIFDTFAQKFGYDPRPLLPLIYEGTTDEAKRVRAQFYAHVGDLVSENYFGQIQEWCEANGTKLSGHLILEEQMFYHVPIYGNYVQCSLNMGYPGFDILDPRPANYIANMSSGGKYASSPAWLSGQERVFVEICPVVNAEEFATNHLDYALGTMTFVYFDGGNQVATYYTQANSEMTTGRAFNNYIGRMGSITVGAQNKNEIALYYGIDTVAGEYVAPENQNVYSAVNEARKNDIQVDSLVSHLRKAGLDYVVLDSTSMKKGTVNGSSLEVGTFSFKTILVPYCKVMRIEDVRILEQLIENGANVIFVGSMPSIAFEEKDQAELDDFVARHGDLLKNIPVSAVKAITTKVALSVEAKQTIYVSPYERDGIEFFFLANASADDASMTLHYEGAVGYRLYNPVNGEITEISADEACHLASYRALFVQPLMAE